MNKVGICIRAVAITIFILSLGNLAAQVATIPNSSISGVVVSQYGAALNGVRIIYYKQGSQARLPSSPFGSRSRPVAMNGIAHSDETGAFEISKLTEGRYVLCAEFSSVSKYLDGCIWGQAPTIVDLGKGQSVGAAKITASPASIVDIRVEDPQGLVLTCVSYNNYEINREG